MSERDRSLRLPTCVLVLALLPLLGHAAQGPQGESVRHCPRPVAALPPAVPAAFDGATRGEVRLTFIGHSTSHRKPAAGADRNRPQ